MFPYEDLNITVGVKIAWSYDVAANKFIFDC